MGNAWKTAVAWLRRFNRLAGYASGVAIVACTVVLAGEVAVRYWLKWPTDWEIELCVMLLIIATFMGAAFTQQERSHVSIEVLDKLLPAKVERVRAYIADLLSVLVCAFIAWKAWQLFHEAWADGRVSNSVWAPKLWIPYFFMALGMTTLSFEIFAETVEGASVEGHDDYV